MQKNFLSNIAIVSLGLFAMADGVSAAPKSTPKIPTKICINSTSGVVTPRAKCKNSETRLSSASIAGGARLLQVATSGAAFTSIDSALTAASLLNPSAASPVLIRVAPGTFSLGSSGIALPSHVSIEGSGINTTILEMSSANGISLTDNTRVSHLKLNSSVAGSQNGIVTTQAGSSRVNDVEIAISEGGASSIVAGMSFNVGTVTLENVKVSLTNTGASSQSFGLSVGLAGTAVTATHLDVTVQGNEAYAFWLIDAGEVSIRDSRGSITGNDAGSNGAPARLGGASASYSFQNVSLHSALQSSTNEVVYLSEATDVRFENSRLISEPVGAGGNGVFVVDTGGKATITNSVVETGATSTGVAAYGAGSVIQVGSSKLGGGAVVQSGGGVVTCAGVYDENFTFSASTCP